jgi:hypothetical protein
MQRHIRLGILGGGVLLLALAFRGHAAHPGMDGKPHGE